MLQSKHRSLFGVMIAFCAASPSVADNIRESNYLHIDPSTAIHVSDYIEAHRLKGRILNLERVQVGAAFTSGPAAAVALSRRSPELDSVALLFDVDLCAFGFQISLPSRDQSNSIPVDIRFLTRDGETVDALRRYPALGTTTRQAYSSEGFAHRFAAVQIISETRSEMGIGEIRALPCSVATS